MSNRNRHKYYELLNLLGYGLAKFDNEFIKEWKIIALEKN
ncbi:Zn-finger [Streptococcus suis]|uniref:Zn-finger n=1 Tax=Streptococcus suis TaxID=1307 RepID=A0A116R077_STRSU|nr:Zn-finger [Streptococcus suis]